VTSRSPRPDPDGEPAPEREIILAAQRGSEEAFGELVRRHERRAYAVARSISATHEDAEDAVQEGFLHAWRALDRFRVDQPFSAWLGRIVANAALDLARRRKVRATEVLPEGLSLPSRDPAADAELRQRLGAALETLSVSQKAVVVLHDVEGFTHEEIGGWLGVTDGTSKAQLHRARMLMRRHLGKE
jgi:RNA polymerase sigma-70 factor (ECF subfamily)